MRYVTRTGRQFVLSSHSLAEWAERVHAALVHLGCSPEYAAAERDLIATATRATE
jgi:hypothetical protein